MTSSGELGSVLLKMLFFCRDVCYDLETLKVFSMKINHKNDIVRVSISDSHLYYLKFGVTILYFKVYLPLTQDILSIKIWAKKEKMQHKKIKHGKMVCTINLKRSERD